MENMVSSKSSMKNEEPRMANAGISMKDIVDFFMRNQRRILLCGVAGLLFTTANLALTPSKYEARWQMQMANSLTATATATAITSKSLPH